MDNANAMRMYATPDTSITIIEAIGNRIKTLEYGELIDLESGCWAAGLGHSRPEVIDVIHENIRKLIHTHQFFYTEHPGALVKELSVAADLKCNYKGSFMSSGSEAVSVAIMLADLLTGRNKKLCFSISYLGALPNLRMPRSVEQWLDLDISECLSCSNCSNCMSCGKFKDLDFKQFSAFVFEPGNSGGLVLFAPDKLIEFLSMQTRNAGGFIIVNEVTTGFGRTGKWFGFQHYDYFNSKQHSPDFIAMGKGLGNGYPVSGVLAKASIANQVESTGFRYVQSHTDDPLGCLIGRKVVEIMSKENLVQQADANGSYLRSRLSEISKSTGAILEVHGRGMMNTFVLDQKYHAVKVFKELLKNGFFSGYAESCNLIRMYAPLTTKLNEIDILCDVLENILR